MRILETDTRHIFTLALYVPDESSSAGSRLGIPGERWVRTHNPLDLSWYIGNEASVEAGNMAVSVCGTPYFEKLVREGVKKSDKDIYLFTAGFQPEGSRDSESARSRLTQSTGRKVSGAVHEG
jgi:hypothetical protein